MDSMDFSARGVDLPAKAILRHLSSGVMVTHPGLPDNPIVYVNPAFESLTGYAAEEVLGRNWQFLHGPETDPVITRKLGQAMAAGQGYRGLMLSYRRDGTPFWNGLVISPVLDELGDLCYFVWTMSDVTASREQLRALAARLAEVREEERSELSRDIHDQLGQALTGLKLDVSWLQRRLRQDGASDEVEELRDKLQEMAGHIDGTIQSVRRIATRLRPAMLDDLGLEAAIEWELEEFRTRSSLSYRFVSSLKEEVLEPEQATALFRILQESLTNIARHAAASHVNVALKRCSGEVYLEVRDNGRGLRSTDSLNVKSIGLLGMRERAAAVRGHVEIQGRVGRGTVVRARLPLKRPQAPRTAAGSRGRVG